MISVIAAIPLDSERAELLRRQIAHFSASEVFWLDDCSAAAFNAALAKITGDRILLIDSLSVPVGDWQRVSFPQRFGILGGVTRTYAGTRAGYTFDRSAGEAKSLRRIPLALLPQRSQTQNIDLPNEGCLLVRRSTFAKNGPLNETLPLELALVEFTLRARENNIEIGFDASISIDRNAGAVEPTLHDETCLSNLCSDLQWSELLHGPARRAELRTVHVLAHGVRDERRLQKWLHLAGYPIAHASITDVTHPGSLITDELRHRNRNLACIDLQVEPVQDWLLTLIEATAGRTEIGIVTCDTRPDAHRILSADGTATLIVNERIPAQISLRDCDFSFDSCIADICEQSAALGVVSHSVALPIERPNGWQPRHLDVHTLEAMLDSQWKNPSVSLILLAGSAASVHRYTTDALRSYSDELEQMLIVVRSDAPKITARLRNHPNVDLFVDTDDEFAGGALSRAMAAATGEIIVIMRDDYLVAEHWLETMIAHLRRMPQVGIVAPRLSAVKGVQNCEEEAFADSVEFRLAAERRRRSRAREAKAVDIVHMPSFVMRRSVVEKIGGFDSVLATSHSGVIDYCVRARSAGFGIVVAEDVFVHHIPFEHTNLPFDALMADSVYDRHFIKKWGLNAENLETQALDALIGSALSHRHRFVMLETERETAKRPEINADEARVILLLPVMHESTWQQAGSVVRKYLMTFTSEDKVTLAIGRQDGVRTSVVAQRIRKMISDNNLDESAVPDIVISDAQIREHWLSSLPGGPRYLLLADEGLPAMPVWEDLSPSGLRRTVAQFVQDPA